MAKTLHRTLPSAENHVFHSWEVADLAARMLLAPSGADIGRVAMQLDDGSFWVFTGQYPVAWRRADLGVTFAANQNEQDAAAAAGAVLILRTDRVDVEAPVITAFATEPVSNGLTVNITSLVATDNVGVTGYLVKEGSTPPALDAAGWVASPPTSILAAGYGSTTFYAWAKDARGNLSGVVSSDTLVQAAVPVITADFTGADGTQPSITDFPASGILHDDPQTGNANEIKSNQMFIRAAAADGASRGEGRATRYITGLNRSIEFDIAGASANDAVLIRLAIESIDSVGAPGMATTKSLFMDYGWGAGTWSAAEFGDAGAQIGVWSEGRSPNGHFKIDLTDTTWALTIDGVLKFSTTYTPTMGSAFRVLFWTYSGGVGVFSEFYFDNVVII